MGRTISKNALYGRTCLSVRVPMTYFVAGLPRVELPTGRPPGSGFAGSHSLACIRAGLNSTIQGVWGFWGLGFGFWVLGSGCVSATFPVFRLFLMTFTRPPLQLMQVRLVHPLGVFGWAIVPRTIIWE